MPRGSPVIEVARKGRPDDPGQYYASIFADLRCAATAPEVSPFSYAAALLGVLVLGAKLLFGASNE
jgi:hypothetical protein